MASTFRLVPAEPPPSGFQRHIEDFHEFFKARGVSFGSPGDMPPFIARLTADASFRDNIASLVRTAIYRERDGLSRLELVELVSTAVVGPEVENSAVPEVREGVRQVMAFVDGVFRSRWNPGGTSSAAVSVAQEPELAEEPEVAPANPPVDPVAEVAAAEPVQEQAPAMTDLFYRAQVVAGAGPAETIAAERAVEPAAKPEAEPVLRPEPVLNQQREPEPLRRTEFKDVPAEPLLRTRSGDDAMPLAMTNELAGRRSRGWLWAVAVCCLLLAFCAGLFVHQRLLVPLRDPNQPYETPPPETADDTGGAQPAASAGTAGQLGVDGGRASAAGAGARAGSGPVNRQGANGTRSLASRSAGNETVEGRSPAAVEREARPSAGEQDLQPRYMAPAMIGASAGLMSSHLVYAPPPEYPGLARMTHVQGRVLVEAVVGKNGQVIRAEAITGHRLLRAAAVREVYERRYRPYLLNDRPTDVATIVTVEFRLR